MSEFEHYEPELTPFERSLAGLVPLASRIDRDKLMIELGRELEAQRRRWSPTARAWALSTAALLLVSGVLSWQLFRANAQYDALLAAHSLDHVEPPSAVPPTETSTARIAAQQNFIEKDVIESAKVRTGFRRLLTAQDIVSLASPEQSTGRIGFRPLDINSDEAERPQPGERSRLRAGDRAVWSKLLIPEA